MHPTPLDAERAVRRNFGFDAVGALGTGLFNALVVNFLAVIARREGADPLLLAALAAAPFAANILGICSGFWVPSDRHRVRYVAIVQVIGRALFFGALVSTGPIALLLMGLGMLAGSLLALVIASTRVVLHYDEPQVHTVLEEGMTFTIEPMITLGTIDYDVWDDDWTVTTKDKKWTAQFEHTLVVTDDGAEILTAMSHSGEEHQAAMSHSGEEHQALP